MQKISIEFLRKKVGKENCFGSHHEANRWVEIKLLWPFIWIPLSVYIHLRLWLAKFFSRRNMFCNLVFLLRIWSHLLPCLTSFMDNKLDSSRVLDRFSSSKVSKITCIFLLLSSHALSSKKNCFRVDAFCPCFSSRERQCFYHPSVVPWSFLKAWFNWWGSREQNAWWGLPGDFSLFHATSAGTKRSV